MGSVTLITGGSRSGKSTHALALADWVATGDGRRIFVATAQPLDAEMRDRIAAHRANRSSLYETLEEPLALAEAMQKFGADVRVLILDCVTLWISNLLGAGLENATIVNEAAELADALVKAPFRSIVVTGEVGSGIVPDNPLGRRYRDLLGWTNQKIAAVAESVLLMVAGYPMRVK